MTTWKMAAWRVGAIFLFSMALVGCQKAPSRPIVDDRNLVRANPEVDREIGDDEIRLQAIGTAAFQKKLNAGSLLAIGSLQAKKLLEGRIETTARFGDEPAVSLNLDQPQSLLLGLPTDLIGKPAIFGGVFTAVSDTVNEDLGDLKLTDLAPIHATPLLARTNQGGVVLGLVGCIIGCTSQSPQELLLSFPVHAVSEDGETVVIDLAPIGQKLDLARQIDPSGQMIPWITRESRTSTFDFSDSTLVFDIESTMVPKDAGQGAPGAPTTLLTARWYLKLGIVEDPAFISREPTRGVGYFGTDRNAREKIQRFAHEGAPTRTVHYFIKNVPQEYRASFAGAFDAWNEKFEELLGRKLLSYEFVEVDDPRHQLLVPGDVRYNILEWDLVNAASYGGLGPSMADQTTGETFSANVLIQGPMILSLYREWFKVTEQAQQLREQGDDRGADLLLVRHKREFLKKFAATEKRRFVVKLGDSLELRVVSQMPELQDPLFDDRADFDDVPAGHTFETYMPGYFHEMVTHELGHNLGLRHNFRGNLGAGDTADRMGLGQISRSIMDYTSKLYRHMARIGEYDVMALAYGYLGRAPGHLDWFCTDQNVAEEGRPGNSAECSRDDSGNDPYSNFVNRLGRAIDFIVARGQPTAPVWKISDMERVLKTNVNGIALYAYSAERTAASWTNFFQQPGRPSRPADVKGFVADELRAQLCDPSLEFEIASKLSPEDRTKTRENLQELRAKVQELLAPYGLFGRDGLNCPALL